MRLYVFLELASTLEIHCLRLVVDLAVSEDLHYVLTKLLSISIFTVAELLLNSLEINGLLDH